MTEGKPRYDVIDITSNATGVGVYLRENKTRNSHKEMLVNYEQQYPDLIPEIRKIIRQAKYPDILSSQKIICELEEIGIPARSRQIKTVITYFMPKLGYDICRGKDGTMKRHVRYQTYFRVRK